MAKIVIGICNNSKRQVILDLTKKRTLIYCGYGVLIHTKSHMIGHVTNSEPSYLIQKIFVFVLFLFWYVLVHEPGPEIWPIGTTQRDKGLCPLRCRSTSLVYIFG